MTVNERWSVASYVSSACTAVAGWFASAGEAVWANIDKVGITIGILCAVATYATNLWFAWDRRKWDQRIIRNRRK